MSTDRPKRNIVKKRYDDSEGIPWCEERVVRKVLFLSLREFRSGQRSPNAAAAPAGSSTKRHRSASNGGMTGKHSQRAAQKQHGSRVTSEDHLDRKRPRLQAQRKFAQSQPSSPSSTPMKASSPDPVTVAPSNHRPPKTEDFLSYLCLRGSVALPDTMAQFGSVQDAADLQEDEDEEEMVPEGGAAVRQGFASCLATNQRGRHLVKKMPNSAVLPSHGRCLRGRAPGATRRPGEAVQGPERRERPPASTTTASTLNPLRHRCPRDPPRPPRVSMATGLSGITSSTRRAACAKRTPPLRLLPPRAARSSAPPPRPLAPPSSRSSAPPPRSLAPPSSRSSAPPPRSLAPSSSKPTAPPSRTPALHSRSSTSRSRTRRGKKTRLSFRRRHPNSRHPKPLSRRSNQRHPPLRQAARGQQNRNPRSPLGEPRSAGALRQSRRRRGLPAEVMEVRLQVSGPRTRSRTLSRVGGKEGLLGARHVGKVPSKQRHAPRASSEGAGLTRQAQASQG